MATIRLLRLIIADEVLSVIQISSFKKCFPLLKRFSKPDSPRLVKFKHGQSLKFKNCVHLIPYLPRQMATFVNGISEATLTGRSAALRDFKHYHRLELHIIKKDLLHYPLVKL